MILELSAGDIAFIPSFWWHITETLETSISVSGNIVGRDNYKGFLQLLRDEYTMGNFTRLSEVFAGFDMEAVMSRRDRASTSEHEVN